ncbi:DUF4062 domain-containing protein [Paenibacillus sp. UMB4589-SE434]|uniref:DUF4062 domain-containing protein n=1 Tax=Paenibacillus sp. UMB4589-SE434 TaxID=3046314 RepID=UPI002549FEE1|nr:DUF4062 domain-containing protein [Paenibacillus sp. UMB4589-SE434]MDK8182026.1 DUF4062 domain-containing protein [Paenibacillus sp. UMB4589-SE434]
MKKKLQVFVSSTFLDLKDERQKAVEGILRAGHIPAGMELFTAASKSQWKVIEDWIKESDILMLIFGGKYGTVEPESGKSYTQLEYEFALKNNIPVFALVLNDQFLANKKSADISLKVYEHEVDKPEIEKYKMFKALVESNLVRFIGNISEISTEVVLSLNDFNSKDSDEYHFRGWIRGTDVEASSVNGGQQGNSKLFMMDEELLNKVINKIEEESFIDIIEDISTYCSYNSENTKKIDELIYFSKEPSARFFNSTIQSLFVKLVTKLDAFTDFTGIHFFPKNDRLYLYPELNIDLTYVDEEGRKRYDKYYSELSRISRETIQEIRDFIYQSRIALYK